MTFKDLGISYEDIILKFMSVGLLPNNFLLLNQMGIKKVSSKMSKLNTAYSKLRRQYLTDKPVCHAKIHKCSVQATDVHHKHGRGVYYLDTSTWLPVCRNCHMWIEEHPEESYELGFSGSRT